MTGSVGSSRRNGSVGRSVGRQDIRNNKGKPIYNDVRRLGARIIEAETAKPTGGGILKAIRRKVRRKTR